MKQAVRLAQIRDEEKRLPMQRGEVGKEVVCSHEERDLDKQAYRTTQGIRRVVVVLPVVGVQDHVLLVTREHCLDPVHPTLQPLAHIAFRLLDLLRYVVEGKGKDSNGNAQPYNGNPIAIRKTIEKGKDIVDQQFDRENQEVIERCQHVHLL